MNTTMHEDRLVTADVAEVARGGGDAPRNAQGSLFPGDAANDLRARWNEIQAEFVDEPKKSVEQADELVAQAIQRLNGNLTEERNRIARQGDHGNDGNTEDLRVSLQSYRSL